MWGDWDGTMGNGRCGFCPCWDWVQEGGKGSRYTSSRILTITASPSPAGQWPSGIEGSSATGAPEAEILTPEREWVRSWAGVKSKRVFVAG